MGPATFHRLIAEHGSATAALQALPDIAAAAGIDSYAACPEGVAQAELAAGRRAGARLIRHDSPDYPALLREIPDAPPILWVRGNLGALRRPMIGVIGARNASSLGLRMARGLSQGLAAAGVTVAAGLARGVDTAAHEATCEAGTVAVMAGGIDLIYPAENRALADRILVSGCLVTEQPPGLEPVARHFPARNRIVSGLSLGVVVIEAAHRSGTLITARFAAEQGREVMAVPGHPIDARASGCNALIRDGATLVRNAADVLAAVGLAAGAGDGTGGEAAGRDGGAGSATGPHQTDEASGGYSPSGRGRPRSSARAALGHPAGSAVSRPAASARSIGSAPPAASGPEDEAQPGPAPAGLALPERLLRLIGPSPTEEDSLIRDLGVSPAQLAPVILDLELAGRIQRLPGGRIALAA